MKNSLLEWDKLLRYTGGALSLNKITLVYIDFQQKQMNDSIQIPSEEIGNKMYTLERLDPWKSERILGVRVPMDGNMKNESKYRTKQTEDMAKKLYHAPFTPKDAEMVYQARYKPAIWYALVCAYSYLV